MPISPLRRAGAAAAVAAVGATTALVGSPGSPASAQTPCYPPSPGCFITTTSSPDSAVLGLVLSDIVVSPGETITVRATGFAPNTDVTFSIDSVVLGTFRAGPDGTVSGRITIPLNTSLGAHTIFVRGTGSNGLPGSVSRGITVVAAGTGTNNNNNNNNNGKLARTGAIVVPTALVGLGLVAGGAALKRSSRRGKSSSAA